MSVRFTEQEFLDQMVALRTGLEEDSLWERIARLPRELKNIVATYSRDVYMQKQWLRHQFFRRWTVENVDRLIDLASKWTKRQITWFMTHCNYYNYTCFILNKIGLITQLKKRIGRGCEQHFNGQWLYCVTHARKVWQRLQIIDFLDKTFKGRKSLENKRRKAEKRLREI
jgi:hypothetical protein